MRNTNLVNDPVTFHLGKRKGSLQEKIVGFIFFLCASVSIVTTIAIIGTLLIQSIPFFQEVGIWEFISGDRWSPILKPRAYGVLPLVFGTSLVAFLSLLVAVPVGLLLAIFLSEYSPKRLRSVLKPVLEILAGESSGKKSLAGANAEKNKLEQMLKKSAWAKAERNFSKPFGWSA